MNSGARNGQDRKQLAISRRCVLQASLATAVTRMFRVPHVFAAESRSPLRIAAIGVGNRGFDNLLAVATENIVALCDVDTRYLKQASDRFPDAEVFCDYRELFQRAELDAVVISTPDHSHALPIRLALERNLHVYCEKPLVHNLRELALIEQLTQQTTAATQMGNHHHASGGYQQAVRWLREGRLGRVSSVHCWTNRPLWPQGRETPKDQPPVPDYLEWDLWLGPAADRPYHPAYHPLTWRGWWDFGTGAIGDMLPHLLDPVFAGLELGLPQTIEAETSGVRPHSAPEWSRVRFTFPTAKDAAPLIVHWYDGGQQPEAELAGARRLPANGCLVIGEQARLFIPERGGRPLLLAPDGKRIETQRPRDVPDAHTAHHREWLEAARGGEPTRSPFSYGAQLTSLALLGNLAIRSGRTIDWDASRHAPRSCPEAEPYLGRSYRDGWQLD